MYYHASDDLATTDIFHSCFSILGSKKHCQAEEKLLIEEEDLEENVVEHSEIDDQGTAECEGLEVEEKENKGAQKRKRRKLITNKVSMYILSECICNNCSHLRNIILCVHLYCILLTL